MVSNRFLVGPDYFDDIVDAQSRVAGAGIAINQQISSNFDGLSALWPAAPPEPRGSGSSINYRAEGALRSLQPTVLRYGFKSCPYMYY